MGFFDKLLGGGTKTPFTADPQQTANQQELLNRYNITSPYGGRSFTTDANGRLVLNITETPFQMQQRATREALASDYLASLAGGDDRFAAEAKRIGDVTFERGLARLQPTIDAARRRTEVATAAQGLPAGSEARTALMNELGAQESDLYTNLAQTSELAASQEQSRLRNLAAQEAAAFLSPELSGVDVGNFSNVAGSTYANDMYTGGQLKLDRWAQEATRQNIQRQNAIDLMAGGLQGSKSLSNAGNSGGSLASFGSGLASFFSDGRLKENIKYHDTKNGFKRYIYNYIGDTTKYLGVMAQEVRKVLPEAITEDRGHMKVNYAMLGFGMEVV